jgi:hypothetical protein
MLSISGIYIPIFVTDLTTAFESSMAEQIRLNRDFGIGYDSLGTITGTPATWYLITSTNLAINAEWSEANAGSTAGVNSDASWFVQFVTDGSTYTASSRALDYFFGSVLQTRFFFYGDQQIFDSRTGTVIRDFVNVLKTNSKPDSSLPLASDTRMRIVGQPVQSDGYVDDYQVLVSFQDSDIDGVPDNPDIFDTVVSPTTNPNNKYVFFVKTYGYDSFVTYTNVSNALVNTEFINKVSILPYINNYVEGQIFYTTTEQAFYVLDSSAATGPLTLSNDYIARVGRQDLYFQYRHNAPGNRRLDPSPNNLIDLYVLTKEYEAQYRAWALDTTGTATEPSEATNEALRIQFGDLENYKSVSDALVFNNAKF